MPVASFSYVLLRLRLLSAFARTAPVLQTGSDLNELIVHLRHLIVQVADGRRSADASNDVLALCIDQVLAHQLLSAGGGVTGECNAGAGTVAGVAEGHLLDVDSGAPLVGDLVHLTVDVCTGVVPAAEDGLDSLDQLIAWDPAGRACPRCPRRSS